MNSKIKIMIVDDHSVVRKGIINLLEDEENIEIVGEASDGVEAIEKIKEFKPQIVFLDLTMPKMSGFEVARIISQKHTNIKTLIFSMHNNQEYMVEAVENGAMGYLLKDTSKEEILKAIETVSQGTKYFPPNVSALIIDALLIKKKESSKSTSSRKEVESPINILSKQEKVILGFIIDGMSSQEISEKLNLSVRTISNHRANMMKKTKVKNTAELVRLAMI